MCFNKDSSSLLIFFAILAQNTIYLDLEKNLGSFLGAQTDLDASQLHVCHSLDEIFSAYVDPCPYIIQL